MLAKPCVIIFVDMIMGAGYGRTTLCCCWSVLEPVDVPQCWHRYS